VGYTRPVAAASILLPRSPYPPQIFRSRPQSHTLQLALIPRIGQVSISMLMDVLTLGCSGNLEYRATPTSLSVGHGLHE
jgi:hypothetical protein